MTEFCRLCADLKDPDEIVASIDDVEQSMEQKLWACCQWTAENIDYRLPHSVCSICLDKLEKSWLFAQSVQLAQQRLLEIFVNESAIETKPLIAVMLPPAYGDASTHTNLIAPTVMIPFGTRLSELVYTEYHPIDGDGDGQVDEFNDLNEDMFSEYFEENKNDIVPIQTDDHANDVSRAIQVGTHREHKCTECGQQFSSKSNLNKHRAHKHRSHECWLCHKTFGQKFHLAKHMLVHTQNARAKRRLGKSNRWKQAKGSISRRNTKSNSNPTDCNPKDRPYQCECGRRYKLKSNLISHQKQMNHSNGDVNGMKREHELLDVENSLDYKLSELFSLILTGEEQDEKVNKKRPISRISNDSNQFSPFRCDECGKEFTLRRGLVTHRRMVHTLEEPIECEHCGKFFKHAHSLRRHRQLFSIEYPPTSDTNGFTCDDCGRTFVRKLWLLKHRQSHSHITANRSHQSTKNGLCDVVKSEYVHSIAEQSLNDSNECQFECWLCHEMFAGRLLLQRHFEIHMLSPEIRRLKAELIYHHC